MLPPIEELLIREKPALVVVYGDTNSTLGGTLAATKLNIPVAHIEAGLRSYDRTMPEEVNRVLTDHVSQLLFCPTQVSVDNLAKEGIVDDPDGANGAAPVRVLRVGDVMTDVASMIAPLADARWPALAARADLNLPERGTYGVVTMHRASNTEPDAMRKLIEGFRAAAIPLVFPMHPRTRAAFERSGLHVDLAELPNMHILPSLGYIDLAAVVRRAALRADRLGRPAEGGVRPWRAMHHAARYERVGRDPAGRHERAGAHRP